MFNHSVCEILLEKICFVLYLSFLLCLVVDGCKFILGVVIVDKFYGFEFGETTSSNQLNQILKLVVDC